tara:strand:- start:1146 stop:1406 length:261 start_codon:yes stop_codon:yes gene_type:complete
MTDKKEEKLTELSKWEEVVKYFEEDESPAEKNRRLYDKTTVAQGKKEPIIPQSKSMPAAKVVKGTDQEAIHTTIFGHIFRKYRTLV